MARLTSLAKTIKRHCLEKGITQVELARRLGMSKIYLSKIMYGWRAPGMYTEALARELGLQPEVIEQLAPRKGVARHAPTPAGAVTEKGQPDDKVSQGKRI